MFGHAPQALAGVLGAGGHARAHLHAAHRGRGGGRPAARREFGLALWQVTATATDANRYVLRWARGITGRHKTCVFHGCYHGGVEDTFVALKTRPAIRQGLMGEVATSGDDGVVIQRRCGAGAALTAGDIALRALAEPAMTNIAMVLPEGGFMRRCAA